MYKYIILFLLTAFPFAITAQGIYNQSLPRLYTPVNFHLQTGVSAGTGFGGNYFQSYISPVLAKPLTKKLTMSAGVTYSHTTLSNMPLLNPNAEVQQYSGALNTLTMHTSGIYRMNDKLTFTGSAYKTINPAFNARLNPQSLKMEAQGVSFGVNYKLSENATIGGEIRYNQAEGMPFLDPSGIPFGYGNPYNRGGGLFPFGY